MDENRWLHFFFLFFFNVPRQVLYIMSTACNVLAPNLETAMHTKEIPENANLIKLMNVEK